MHVYAVFSAEIYEVFDRNDDLIGSAIDLIELLDYCDERNYILDFIDDSE